MPAKLPLGPMIILWGGQGTGKTTTLAYLRQHFARARHVDNADRCARDEDRTPEPMFICVVDPALMMHLIAGARRAPRRVGIVHLSGAPNNDRIEMYTDMARALMARECSSWERECAILREALGTDSESS